jgi:hypothetical protein
MQQILNEGNNINKFENIKITNLNYIYIEAEKILDKGYKMYNNNNLVETFVLFMKVTKLYELVCNNSHLIISNKRHINLKKNFVKIISIMEIIKPQLIELYGNKKLKISDLPTVPQNIPKEKLCSGLITCGIPSTHDKTVKESLYSQMNEEKTNMIFNLENRWNILKPQKKEIIKPLKHEDKIPPNNINPKLAQSIKKENNTKTAKTTDDIINTVYVDKAGKAYDALYILKMHLKIYNREIIDVPGDNNCQFHAVVDQLNKIQIKGWTDIKLRKKAVQWLIDNENRTMDDGALGKQVVLKDAAGITDWKKYTDEMALHNKTWGDETTLLAISVLFKIEIIIISSLPGNYVHSIKPPVFWQVELENKIYLGHYHEFHYVSTKSII